MGTQACERAATRSRLLGAGRDVAVKAGGFAATWKRFADSAPKVERTLARLAGQGPEFPCEGPESLYTTSDQAMRVCECLRPSSEFAVREPRLLVTAPDFPLTNSEIMGNGSEQAVHSSDSVSNPTRRSPPRDDKGYREQRMARPADAVSSSSVGPMPT
jgi:hypothetical protein